MSRRWRTLLVGLVCLSVVFVDAGLVQRTNVLSVKVGRTLFLNPDDILIRRIRNEEETCRVQVVQNDPITQRVGRLEPTIFDCQYPPNTVKYVHTGSPFLNEDQVKLRVYRFTHRRTISETFYLNVKVNNASTDIVVTRGLRHVIVPEFNGISNTIDASVLRFSHSRSPNVSCTVSFNRRDLQWPLVGHIVMGEQHTPVDGLRKSCQEFLFMDLKYEHLQKPTPDVDYLPLSIELFDPETSDEVITERYFLPIYIKNALLNSPPRSSHMSKFMMEANQFILSTIMPGDISAEDYETPNSLLVYNISKVPGVDEGFFVNLDDRTLPITSFLQDDLENHRIGYQPPNISFDERRIYEFEFTVFDSHFFGSMPIVLHIAVKPTSSNAPMIAYNTGLILLEGQSRPIDTDNLQIVDRNNLKDIRASVTEGLEHGQLLVNNKPSVYFTIDDLTSGSIRYVHDDSESIRDNIGLKISDGSKNIFINFPITIIPKDDNAPYVVNNLGLELNEGETKRIDISKLSAHDTDSLDLNIIYFITQPTEAGEIIRRIRPADAGTRISKFTQRELTKGQIYYRHFGHEDFRDEFLFTLRDQQSPPNESPVNTFCITVNPVNENPPQLSPDATRLMHVSESDITIITKTELEYTDRETEPGKLSYIITTPPYFVYNTGRGVTEDAGKIISLHNLTMMNKDGNIPPVGTFKQLDINHRKIGYMPPMRDIGPEPRLVRFVYTVQDSSGNKVLGQQFDINVEPVNDKSPVFMSTKLLVEEGGILGISSSQLSAVDEDTNESELLFVLEEPPTYGRLQNNGVNLNPKDSFTMLDLRKKDLRYIHDGSESFSDFFTLSVFDGINRISKVFEVHIVPIDDEAPKLRDNLRPTLIVSEGGEAIITSKFLAATDKDTEDGTLVFLIVKKPRHGIMQLNGEPITKFTQQNVKDRLVKYIHSSGDIGAQPVRDSVTVIVSDQHFLGSAALPTYSLNISITPVDNQIPAIITGTPIVVDEGGKFVFSPDVITAKDPDTEPASIHFVITKQPQWGYLENSKPSSGSEISNAGNPVTTFKLQDLIDRSISYVQSTHKGVEPTFDSFEFYATDGRLNSLRHTARITITPVNDEEPDLMLNDFHVDEGGSRIIDQSMVDAIDLDVPAEKLRMFISQAPEHGDIVVMRYTPNGDIEASVTDFSAEELQKGMKLKYNHDNSEQFKDKFAITVSDGKHEVKKVCNVVIEPVNDERPEMIKNTGIQIEYGGHATLSQTVLKSIDIDNIDESIFYILVATPKKGVLQYCNDPRALLFSSGCREMHVGQNFTQKDIDNNNIRYVHTSGMGDTEFDSFMFVLTDGEYKRPVESFKIRITNSKRSNIALLNNGLDVREGERAIITTFNLSASDDATRADEIVFAIIRPPMLGQIEYIDIPLTSISSFTQLDLASQKIVYNHLTKTDFIEDSFTFTVTNGLSDAKDSEFKIAVEPIDDALPTLAVNSLVEVLQGAEIAITPLNLRADDPDTDSSNVTYNIAKLPTHGRLFNRGLYITSLFTQSAVDRGFITYESDGTHTGLDNFLFTVSDGRHEGFLINGTLQKQPAMSSIFIKPLVNDAPKLMIVKHPDFLEQFDDGRYGFELNSKVLKAVDSDTTNTQLVYIIEQKPKHGHIENSQAKRYVRRRFTQRDLDDNVLQFIIDLQDKETNDSFEFRIVDNRGNSLDNQRLEFRWSVIEFEKPELVVCENIGTLSLTLRREGDLSKSAFVSIDVQDRSTRAGDDYMSSSARQVQFDSGMSTASWEIRVLDDGHVEGSENMVAYIQDPVNAVLGRKRKIRIRLINAVNGECPQFLDIVSRNKPRASDTVFLPNTIEGGHSETIIIDGALNSIDRKNPFDNTYNTESAQSVDGSGRPVKSSQDNVDKSQKKKRRKKRRRNKKDRKKRKRLTQKNEEEEKEDQGVKTMSGLVLQNVDIKAPQNCAESTNGLLYFDQNTQQMYKCNGKAWQAWSPASNQDQQPETKECQQGWSKFENRCFKFINERLTWEVAETLCQMSYGAHLSTVQSKKHQTWLSELSGRKAYWIGLNDKEETGVWSYSNGESMNYSNWKSDTGPRVKQSTGKRRCVIVNKNKSWKNKICNKRKSRLLCEQDIGAGDGARSPPKRDVANNRDGRSKQERRRRRKQKNKQNDGQSTQWAKKGFFYGDLK